ncbi:MAG: bifunctional folylpolyglutamate synthase/dihydrofolate synthase [Breznakibacter sp.]|nr:bifunctional folylpolyglutamate synthase/dihydrofolate synthase [Breznakibacter sp.]
MTYQKTIEFLHTQLPVFQREGSSAYKANLNNTLALDERLNHPHIKYKTIHVAGTNGKGSVSHTLASILQKEGYKVGLYTSPHLKDFRERIRVNGEMVSEQFVINFTKEQLPFIASHAPSFFELTVAMAFKYFEEMKVDIAVIEVGLGGRLDSTNIISPILSIITNIGYDHTALLGNTLELIAAEKGGIIKEKTPIVIGRTQPETEPIFKEIAASKGAPIYFAPDVYQAETGMLSEKRKQLFNFYRYEKLEFRELEFELAGIYQKENLATILMATELLNNLGITISDNSIREGASTVVETTGLQGRWQTLGYNPLIICDTGHNEDGIKQVMKQLNGMAYKQLHIVLGMVNDKDHTSVLKLLPKNAIYYFTRAQIPRSLDEQKLRQEAQKHQLTGKSYPSVAIAVEEAKKNASVNDLIFIGGSTFIVAEAI